MLWVISNYHIRVSSVNKHFPTVSVKSPMMLNTESDYKAQDILPKKKRKKKELISLSCTCWRRKVWHSVLIHFQWMPTQTQLWLRKKFPPPGKHSQFLKLQGSYKMRAQLQPGKQRSVESFPSKQDFSRTTRFIGPTAWYPYRQFLAWKYCRNKGSVNHRAAAGRADVSFWSEFLLIMFHVLSVLLLIRHSWDHSKWENVPLD